MKLRFLLLLAFLSTFGFAQTKRRMEADLNFIKHVFEVRYAPLEWKQSYHGWDLEKEIATAQQRLDQIGSPTTKEFQYILRDFFNSACDYHVGVSFYSTETATLPFQVKSAGKRYFICSVDRTQVTEDQFPYSIGDELLAFNGMATDQVVQKLRREELGEGNTPETDQSLAEMMLTTRQGERGCVVPSGSVKLTLKKRGQHQSRTIALNWDYVPERIKDVSKLSHKPSAAVSRSELKKQSVKASKDSSFFNKLMIYPNWTRSFVGKALYLDDPHALGSRSSYIPPLGKKVWQGELEDFFDAYIFESPSGKRIGYVRISHYLCDEEEVEEFCELIRHFERYTDGLVIDQINNPGGSVFYLYSLAAALTDRILETPKHHIALTQEEIFMAASLLPVLENVGDEDAAKEELGDTLGGYPVTMHMVDLIKNFCHFLLKEWDSGKLYTDASYIFGVDQIHPHPDATYSKPILVVVNSLDFSGGDFFPAIMQDNKRATILGTRTAGAGGYVIPTQHPNHSGILGFTLTGSLAERLNHDPIENLGVQPDIEYQLSVKDMEENYCEYAQTIVQSIEALIP